MNDSNLYAALNPRVVMVSVAYQGMVEHPEQGRIRAGKPKWYTYKALEEQGIKEGDKVVVDSRGDLVVGEVKVVERGAKLYPNIKYKWVIQRVDTSTHDAIVKREQEFDQALVQMEREKKREALRVELEQRLGSDRVAQLTADFGPGWESPAVGTDSK